MMSNRKPNLFIIGAAKSGTTSLHHHLARHPEIYMSDPKEPGFFAEGLDYYPSDEEWYLSLFDPGRLLRYRGESSTHYSKLPRYPGVAERIASYCDSPRFIYIMRDPIDRAISQYWHHTRKEQEFRSPLRAMKEDVEYKAFSEYARQLKPYLGLFSADQIFTTTFEQLISDPERVTAEIVEWLGLDSSSLPDEFPTKNSAPTIIERSVLGQTVGEFLFQSRTWDLLSPLVPKAIKDVGRKWTTRNVSPSNASMEEVVVFLRPWAVGVAEEVADLLKTDFPEWRTTLGERSLTAHD